MKKIIAGLFVFGILFVGIASFQDKDKTVFEWSEKDTVYKVLYDLGEPKPNRLVGVFVAPISLSNI